MDAAQYDSEESLKGHNKLAGWLCLASWSTPGISRGRRGTGTLGTWPPGMGPLDIQILHMTCVCTTYMYSEKKGHDSS